jgi:hypothetical protein
MAKLVVKVFLQEREEERAEWNRPYRCVVQQHDDFDYGPRGKPDRTIIGRCSWFSWLAQGNTFRCSAGSI